MAGPVGLIPSRRSHRPAPHGQHEQRPRTLTKGGAGSLSRRSARVSAMSDTMVAVVSIVAGSLVGLAGIGATVYGGSQDRSHLRTLATEERTQRRKAEAYVEILTSCRRMSYVIASLLPPFESIPPAPLPDVPSAEEQARTASLVAAFASAEVKSLYDSWREMTEAAFNAYRIVMLGRNSETHELRIAGTREELRLNTEIKPAALAALTWMEDQMAAELDSRPKPVIGLPVVVGEDELADGVRGDAAGETEGAPS